MVNSYSAKVLAGYLRVTKELFGLTESQTCELM